MNHLLDSFDYKIIAILQDTAKITNLELSDIIGLSPAATLERVRKLEKYGVVNSYHAQIDPAAIGLQVNLWLLISLQATTPDSIQDFQKSIKAIQEVVSCYHIIGIGDFLLHIFANDLKAYQAVLLNKLGSIPNIKSVITCSVLDTVKKSGLPLGHLPVVIAP